MIILDADFKEKLYKRAQDSKRLRAHHCFHQSHEEPVQRLAIALMRNSYIPPHKHELSHQWEYFHVIDGLLKLIIFSPSGEAEKIYFLGEGAKTFAMQIPAGTIHTLVCLSGRAMVFELKEGPFNEEYAKVFPEWSIMEHEPLATEIMAKLENIEPGELLL